MAAIVTFATDSVNFKCILGFGKLLNCTLQARYPRDFLLVTLVSAPPAQPQKMTE